MYRKDKAEPSDKDPARVTTVFHCDDNPTNLKWKKTLQKLLEGPKHRFQAEVFGDHALHSTVSYLQRVFGLTVDREWCQVPTRFGSTCRVKRYWISGNSRAKAIGILTATGRESDCEVSS
jgi:hypothetical protein